MTIVFAAFTILWHSICKKPAYSEKQTIIEVDVVSLLAPTVRAEHIYLIVRYSCSVLETIIFLVMSRYLFASNVP